MKKEKLVKAKRKIGGRLREDFEEKLKEEFEGGLETN